MNFRNVIITNVKVTFIVDRATNEQEKIVRRNSYGLTFALDGEIEYIHHDKRYISDSKHLLLLPKGQTYIVHCTKQGLFPVINFDIMNNQAFPEIMSFPIVDHSLLKQLYDQLNILTKSGNKYNHINKLAYLYQLLGHVVIPFEQQNMTSRRTTLQPAMTYLENNYNDPCLNNEQLSKMSCLSKVHFRKLFKEEYGITPKQYVQEVRISIAKELLESKYLSVSAVAEMVGYSNLYHFSKTFKARTGITPTDYMQNPKK